MNFELSTVALIAGAVGFYLMLITAYRRKTREWERASSQNASKKKVKKVVIAKPSFGAFSKKPRDWAVGSLGYAMMMFGVLEYADILKIPGVKPAWYAPVAVGIILFSWFFR